MTALFDRPDRYGVVTRILHWGMAALFAAQFLSAAAHWAFGRDNPVREALWSYHYSLGTSLFLLVLLRGIWGLINIPRRPAHTGTIGNAAVVGHVAIYALMVAVPFVKLLASYGATRPVMWFGVELFGARETEIAWMTVPQTWHGTMGWILAALVLGHIAMAVGYHRLMQRDGVLSRMAGPSPR